MSEKIVLMRHAEVEGGKGRYIGRTELQLSVTGVKNAVLAGLEIKGVDFKAVYSSPLGRARTTAALVSGNVGTCSSCILDGLAEIDLGEWDGRQIESVKKNDPAGYAARGQNFAGFRPAGGESFADLLDRSLKALDAISAGPLPALAVTHAGVIRVIICHVSGRPLDEIFSFKPENLFCSILKKSYSGSYGVSAFNLPPAELSL